MSTHRQQSRTPAPVYRCCALCGQPKTIYPLNDEHRQAHLSKDLAFVCDECAERVKTEVEEAGTNEPRVSA